VGAPPPPARPDQLGADLALGQSEQAGLFSVENAVGVRGKGNGFRMQVIGHS